MGRVDALKSRSVSGVCGAAMTTKSLEWSSSGSLSIPATDPPPQAAKSVRGNGRRLALHTKRQSSSSDFRADRTESDDAERGVGEEDGGAVHRVDYSWTGGKFTRSDSPPTGS